MTTHSSEQSAGRGLASSFARCLARAALACSALFAPGVTAAESNQAPAIVASVPAADTAATRLGQAKAALTGQNKEPERAKKLLLEIVESETRQATLSPSELSYVYVYLGYIADRAGQRDEAVSWHKRALELERGDRGIQECAADGLKRPLTWIRHLDPDTSPPSSSSTTRPPEKGYVTENYPKGMVPAKELSAQQRQENFEFLCDAIDKTYACFELKRIDWGKICQRYRSQLGQTKTTEDFYQLLFQLVAELKDTHSWLQNYQVEMPSSGPGLTVGLFDGRPFVVAVKPGSEAAEAGIGPGAEILKIDGQTVQERMDALRKQLPGRSTLRAFQREAAQYLLAGVKGTTVSVSLRYAGASTNQTCTLKRTAGPGAMPQRTYAFEVTHQQFVHFGRHPSGAGYIRIESFDGRQEIATEFDRALEALKDTPALLLDVRGNPGGYGDAQPHIVGRFITNRTLVAISYRKSGPAHRDLDRRVDFFQPAGNWQYTQPMALLIDDETGSAADLFTCYMRSTGRVLTVGTPTHGNLSGVTAFAVLPCGLIVRISNGYICDAGGHPIESNGNAPEVDVSPTINDVLNGKDPVLEKSAALQQEKCAHASTQH